MLKDNIDEESEGNDYVADEEEAQDTTDESDDDAGEADDSTANGTYFIYLLLNMNLSYSIFV